MSTELIVRIVAGAFVLISLTLGHFSGSVDLSSPSWLWLTAFVGLNLFQSGFTKFCPLVNILHKLGFKDSAACEVPSR
jgi:hypothetical protein